MLRSVVSIQRVLTLQHHRSVGVGTVYRHFTTTTTSETSSNLPSVTLYQYAICPFCHKTKAVMGYVGIQPTIIEVNPLTKAELPSNKGKEKYRKVPIAIVDNCQINGSDAIIDTLLQHPAVRDRIISKSPSLSEDNWQDFLSPNPQQDWVQFANEELAVLMYPNICATLGDSYKAFEYVNHVQSFSSIQKVLIRMVGSFAMYAAASRIKAKRGIADEKVALQNALRSFQENSGIASQEFTSPGRSNPSLGDLAMYGTLRSVEGLPAHDAIMEHADNGALRDWYQRVQKCMDVSY